MIAVKYQSYLSHEIHGNKLSDNKTTFSAYDHVLAFLSAVEGQVAIHGETIDQAAKV